MNVVRRVALMNDDQKRELESFLVQTEGAPPPVFIGREEVLMDIALASEQVWKGMGSGQHGMEKATRIVQGAPGAGKSSILNEIACNSERLRREGVPVPMVVTLKSGDIDEPIDILEPLAVSINPSAAGDFLSRYSRTIGGDAGVSLGPIRVGGRIETSAETTRTRARWNVFKAWVEENGGFDRPITLAIDEAQRFDHVPEDPLSKLFQSLHDGSNLPIVLVLAGLSDTEYSAGRMDLTRIPSGQVHNIGCFSNHGAEELMSRSCAHFGIDIAGFEDEINRLAEPCDCWPRHLHIVLKAFGREALRTGGDLDKADWEGIVVEIRAGRDDYYGHQFSSEMREAKSLMARIMNELNTRNEREEIIKFINECRVNKSDYLFTEGMGARDFFVHLVHKGALHEESVDRFVCPIPSFHTYLLDRGGLTENPAPVPGSTGSSEEPKRYG